MILVIIMVTTMIIVMMVVIHAIMIQAVRRGFPSGIIHLNWNDTENISMAPAQG